jgi:type I restriction enzyme S subunit
MENGWTTSKLGELIQTLKGYAFKSQWYSNVGVPLVKVSNFTDDSIDVEGLSRIPDDISANYRRYTLKTNDVVIQTVGSWPTNPQSVVGKVIRVPIKANGALLNQNAVKIIPNKAVDIGFLFYALKLPTFKNYIVGCAQGAASQASITLDAIKNFDFTFPKLEYQRKISAILSAYDDLIENNTRRIQILEEMARRIYEEWFVWFRFPGHENVKMVESELALIPFGWNAKQLGDIAQEVRNTVGPSEVESSTPYVGLEHIPRRSIALMDWDEAKNVQSTKHIFKAGNILFGKIRPYFHKVSVAPIDGICSTDAIVIEAKKREMFPFVLCVVSSDTFVQHATQTSNGVNMPRANWAALLKYPVYIPTKDLRKRFSDFIEPTLTRIKNLTFKIRNLRQTRDLLLPKLISGEIDVSNFPEPMND